MFVLITIPIGTMESNFNETIIKDYEKNLTRIRPVSLAAFCYPTDYNSINFSQTLNFLAKSTKVVWMLQPPSDENQLKIEIQIQILNQINQAVIKVRLSDKF